MSSASLLLPPEVSANESPQCLAISPETSENELSSVSFLFPEISELRYSTMTEIHGWTGSKASEDVRSAGGVMQDLDRRDVFPHGPLKRAQEDII